MKKLLFVLGFLLLAFFTSLFFFRREAEAPVTEVKSNVAVTNTEPVKPETPAFDKKKYATNDPASLWVIVNKDSPISPEKYVPTELVTTAIGGQLKSEATTALNSLVADAKTQSIVLRLISGYRSYQTQKSVYKGYVAKDGQAAADTYSARPGTSEHQTGWAADLGGSSCDLEVCFGSTAAGKWLAAHAHEHGFIIRYPEGKQAITGYRYEPWHIRYVGKELAEQLFKSGTTMEEFFDVTPDRLF